MDTGIKLKPKSCSITRKRGSFAGFKTYCHMSIGAKLPELLTLQIPTMQAVVIM